MAAKKSTSKSQPNKGKRIFVAILCIVLVLALAASLTANVIIYKKLIAQSDVDTPGTVTPPLDDDNVVVKPIDPSDKPDTPDNPDEPIIKPAVRRLSIAPKNAVLEADSSAVNVPITVTPDVELEGTLIDWTISFKEAASTWATGKTVTDYATITPTSDGAFTANLSVLQAFAEQIIVMASVRGNSDVTAACTVDYAKKYSISNIAVGDLQADAGNEYKSVITPVSAFSEGTIDDPITLSGYLKPTQAFIDFISAVKGVTGDMISADYVTYLGGAQINAAEDKSITADKFAFIKADSTQREGFVATFPGDSMIQHMYRLLGYGFTQAGADATWTAYQTALSTMNKSTVLTANLAFNNYVKAQAQASNITALANGSYVLANAFEVVYTFSGEYNTATTFRKSIPLVFDLLPASVSSLTINPGSIIV